MHSAGCRQLFTHCLLEAMKGASATRGECVIRVFNVFQYVSDKVPTLAAQHPIFKAHDLENNFPVALNLGGQAGGSATSRSSRGAASPCGSETASEDSSSEGSVSRWHHLADYVGIPLDDRLTFEKGREPYWTLEWLKERNRLDILGNAFNDLGYDDLSKVVNPHPR